MQPLPHGGKLREAAQQFGQPLERWLDLSTGINPTPWPVPDVPRSIWQRLPEEKDGLEAAAQRYYQTESLLPVAGTQAAIKLLPRLRPHSRVGLLTPSYNEHAESWVQTGHEILELNSADIDSCIHELDVLVIVNPNNPTGETFNPEQLLNWHLQLSQRGGWLIVDEAFMDATPNSDRLSLLSHCPKPGLIVLRSMGKFFGLAGIRCGFVMAEQEMLTLMQSMLGPWTLSGPSRWVATQALLDQDWQQQARTALATASQRLTTLLSDKLQVIPTGTELFQCCQTPMAGYLYQELAKQGVLTRLFPDDELLRFGLPATETQWYRFEQDIDYALNIIAPNTQEFYCDGF